MLDHPCIDSLCVIVQKKEQNEVQPYQIGFFTKLALLIPGLFIPFAILIVETAATVVPIK